MQELKEVIKRWTPEKCRSRQTNQDIKQKYEERNNQEVAKPKANK